jgi:hypothetical protein
LGARAAGRASRGGETLNGSTLNGSRPASHGSPGGIGGEAGAWSWASCVQGRSALEGGEAGLGRAPSRDAPRAGTARERAAEATRAKIRARRLRETHAAAENYAAFGIYSHTLGFRGPYDPSDHEFVDLSVYGAQALSTGRAQEKNGGAEEGGAEEGGAEEGGAEEGGALPG